MPLISANLGCLVGLLSHEDYFPESFYCPLYLPFFFFPKCLKDPAESITYSIS